jgi:hypothetical protein
MFELIATGSSPLSKVYNDLAFSNSSPTAVAFDKARAERFFRLPSDANERPRGHMQRRVQECQNVNSIGWVGPSRHGKRTSSELGHLRIRMCLALPTLGREGSRWIRLGESSYLRCLMSSQNNSYQKQSPTLQERSPRQILILPDRTLLSMPCITTTLYLLYSYCTAACSTCS